MERGYRNCGSHTVSVDRVYKGNSLLVFPDEYCVIDLETTGYSPIWDNIIEIGAIKYVGGTETGRFQTLVKPPVGDDGLYVSDIISELTGITNDMLTDAPSIAEVLADFSDFLGDSLILGYSVAFDVNFLYDRYVDYLGRPLTNDYVDIMRIARRLFPDLSHHRLKDIVEVYGLENKNAHRAVSDCEATQLCYERMRGDVISQYGDENRFFYYCESARRKSRRHNAKYQKLNAADFRGDESKFNPDCELYGQHCVITGALERYTRAEAFQVIADIGGIVDNGVTKKTNFLILGNNDYCQSIKGGKSTKQKKAEEYMLKGQDIRIIPEAVFYDMIEGFCGCETEEQNEGGCET